jgi:hypothetical protein
MYCVTSLSGANWDGVNPPPNPGEDTNMKQYLPYMYLPKPRIAVHARYRFFPRSNAPGDVRNILLLTLRHNKCILYIVYGL